MTAAHLQDDRDVYYNAGWADAAKILRALFVECLQSEDSFFYGVVRRQCPKNTHDPAKTLGVTIIGKVSGDCGTPGVNGEQEDEQQDARSLLQTSLRHAILSQSDEAMRSQS